jgi:hypothetical protein
VDVAGILSFGVSTANSCQNLENEMLIKNTNNSARISDGEQEGYIIGSFCVVNIVSAKPNYNLNTHLYWHPLVVEAVLMQSAAAQ